MFIGKRKVICFVISMVMLIGIMPYNLSAEPTEPDGNWSDNLAEAFAAGHGTLASPYEIESPEQLALLAKLVNHDESDFIGKYREKIYKLTEDIDLATHYWDVPIGTSNFPFTGTFNGNYHKILNINANNTGVSQMGLFGVVGIDMEGVSAAIHKLGIESGEVKGGDSTGSLVGYAISTEIEECYNKATVNSGGGGVGGLVGKLQKKYSSIKNSYNSGAIRGRETTGGIVGEANGGPLLLNCYNSGEINGEKGLAGIVGKGESGDGRATITNCFNMGNVTGTQSADIRVIAGNTGARAPADSGIHWGDRITNCSYLDSMILSISGQTVTLTGDTQENNYTNGAEPCNDTTLKARGTYEAKGWQFTPEGAWVISDAYPTLFGFLPPDEGTVVVKPDVYIAAPGANVTFTATVVGDDQNQVTWSVEGNNSANIDGTTISTAGVLTIGQDVAERVEIIVTATSETNATKSASAVVTVITPHVVSVAVSPKTTDVYIGKTRQFIASVTVEGNPPPTVGVTWIVTNSSKSTIDSNGLLTVAQDEEQATLTVRATSSFPSSDKYPGDVYDEATVSVKNTIENWWDWEYVAAADSFAGGDGNEASPYEIATAPQLSLLAKNINMDAVTYENTYFKLTADIDLGEYEWLPMGGSGEPTAIFKGTFDGNGHLIDGMKITRPLGAVVQGGNAEHRYGLFGQTENATIKNLGIGENSTVKGVFDIGAIVGRGRNLTIENCYSNAKVESSGNYVGGLVGFVAGPNNNIKNSYNTGEVRGNNSVGGILGGVEEAVSIINCYNSGFVRNAATNEDGSVAGGILGNAWYNGQDRITAITACFNMGNVEGGREAASIAARTDKIFNDCGYLADITVTATSSNPEGIVKMQGNSCTDVQLKQQSTYTGWQFAPEGSWHIDEGNGYPTLFEQKTTEPEPEPDPETEIIYSVDVTGDGLSAHITFEKIADTGAYVVFAVYEKDGGQLIALSAQEVGKDQLNENEYIATVEFDGYISETHDCRVFVWYDKTSLKPATMVAVDD